ncbi:efflux RND transporter permease subunit [Leptospira harrisiae]|uniref:Acriflavin resistance protein n=1 Tax=Leptospira harrisiae TaxID=2023189 RepID=A0A2N0AFC6_9LEPT|nr:efflux RND transporter permease subunit [Leptospira harrisiae]PJZ83005.1 hypothetical protein CH364_18190 [Leptospira harrisiae]PKA06516.1 hypothetical protein CH366_18495 [Leptospira harrisiae]
MVKYFLRKTVTTTVCLVFILGIGAISFSKLKIELFPNITIPTITILTTYPNASIEEMELLVSKPIEEVVASAEGVDETFSETLEGMSIVKVRFRWGTDVDLATVLIREKLDLVKGALPIDVKKPIVLKFDPNDKPIVRIVAFPKSSDFKILRNFIKKNLIPIFEKTDGVATITLSGGLERRILVELDANRMKSYSVTPNEIQRQIASNNENIPSGNIIRGEDEVTVRTMGAFLNVGEIENLILKTSESGAPVYLNNVASVKDSFKDQTSICRRNLSECILVDVRKESGKNTVEVARNIQEVITEINDRFSDILELEIVEDRSDLILSSVKDVASSIILSVVICFIILTIFTGSWVEAILITFSVPTSILVSFICMHFIGQSLNLMSLGGLAVGVGLMVDSSIVVLESIHKEKKNSKDEHLAIEIGASKIAFALVISNLTSIVVFLPNFYLNGLEGIIFKDFALSVCICLASSLMVSLVFLPFFNKMISSKFKNNDRLMNISKNLIIKIEATYVFFLKMFLEKPKVVLMVAFGSLLFAALLASIISVNLMPKVQRLDLNIKLTLPNGTRIQKTSEVVQNIEKLAILVDENADVLSKLGFEEKELTMFPTSEFGLNRAEIFFRFSSFSKKDQFIERLKEMDDEQQKIKIISSSDILSEVLPFSFEQVSVVVTGGNYNDINAEILKLKIKLKEIFSSKEIQTSFDQELNEVRITFDRNRLASFGLRTSDVGDSLKTIVKGDETIFYKVKDEEIPILIRSGQEGRTGIDKLKDIHFEVDENKYVPLKDFAFIESRKSSRILNRQNGKRIGFLAMEIDDQSISSAYNKVGDAVGVGNLNENGTSIAFGENKKILDVAVNGLGIALLFSIILVYMTLAAAMESFLLPLLILFSIFLAAFGVVASLFIFNESINMMSLLGSILLAGIVVNNAILIVEFYRDEKTKFKNTEKLIVEGAKDRLIPILTTTLTSILGLLPLLFSFSGSTSQRSLAASIFGGLIFSTVISLFFIPIISKVMIEKGLMEK